MNTMTEQEAADQAQYGEAFNEIAAGTEDNPEGGVEMPDDATEAAGQDGEEGDGAESGESGAEQIVDSAEPAEGLDSEAEGAAMAGPEADPEPVDGKEEQRLKSWEGRLKKMEAQLLAAKPAPADKLAEAIEAAGEQAQSAGKNELAEAAQEVSEQVEDGTLTAQDAMRRLSEDFGEDFVKMIEAVVSAKAADAGKKAASDHVGQVDRQVKDIISHITDANERSHFERIANAVPDFNDIRQTPEFAQFIEAGGQQRQDIAGQGDASQVIGLLKAFKAQSAAGQAGSDAARPKAKTVSQASVDAATGVRSGGAMSLPAEPADSNDFEGAWSEAARAK